MTESSESIIYLKVEQSHYVTEQIRESLNIVHLDDYSLESILMYVYPNDLVNLAEASPRFAVLAAKVYRRMLSKSCLPTSGKDYAFDVSLIHHFSHAIDHLSIKSNDDFDFRLLNLIRQHFGQHLISLSIRLNHIARYSRMKKIWAKFLNDIHVNFPMLQSLRYNGSDVQSLSNNGSEVQSFRSLKRIVHAYPCLTRLSVNLDRYSIRSLKGVISLNPQLAYLLIDFNDLNLTSDLIGFIDENVANLRHLVLDNIQTNTPMETLKMHRFKNLIKLSLSSPKVTFPFNLGEVFDILAISGDKLRILYVFGYIPSTDAFQHIVRYKNLQDLAMMSIDYNNLMDLARNLPLLERIILLQHRLSTNEIHTALQRFSKLKQLTIADLSTSQEYINEIASRLKGTEWKVTCTRKDLTDVSHLSVTMVFKRS